MKTVQFVLLLFFSITSFLNAGAIEITPDEQAWLEKNKTVRVRIAKEMMPYQRFENNQASGISVEYMQYFANTFNVALEYVTDGTWSEALKRIETRDGVDVLLKATSNTERRQKMLFSQPYISFPFALVTHTSNPYVNLLDGPHITVALAKSYVINEKLGRDYPHVKYVVYETNLEALRAVNANEADAYIGDIAITSLFIKQFGLNHLLINHCTQYEPEEQSVVTGKDWPEFISLYNKVLKTMPEALHVKIKRKYLPFMDEEISATRIDALDLSAEEIAYVNSKLYLNVSNEQNWAPYDFNENGKAGGYAIEYIKLLARKIGIHLNFVSDTWPNILEKFDRKEIDILHPMTSTPQRRGEFLFSEPFISMQLALVAQLKRTEITSLEALKGKTIGAAKSWASTEYLKEQYPEIKVIEYETSQEILEAIAFGLIDAGVEDIFTAQHIMEKEMLSNIRIVANIELEKLKDKNLYLMFQKENALLQSMFNKALKSVSVDELATLNAKFARSKPPKRKTELFTVNEQAYLLNKKEIMMCIDPFWMPLEMNDQGKHVGMAADYIKMMEKTMGIPISVVQTHTWLESIAFAKQRKCDIFSLAMETPERKEYMNFTKPYIVIPLVLVSKLDKAFYSDIGAITDKPIGIAKGYAYGEILKVRYPNVQFVEVESEQDGLKRVEAGKLFGTIGTLATVAYQIQKEYFGSLKIVGKFDEKWELGIGTRNDEPLLHSIFEKAIDAIGKQESQEILNKWVSINYEKNMDYTYLYKILGGIFLVVMVVLYKQYTLHKYNAQLEILSNTDKLTGIFNRLKLDDILEYEKKQFDRFARPLSIVMLDLDFFKKVNDNYGHKAGDETLKSICKIIQDNKRESDVFGRWGGEEFLLVCPETDIHGARALAEKLRKAIETYEFPIITSMTASFGVAEFEKYDAIVKVFDRADHALYVAKESGRNKVV